MKLFSLSSVIDDILLIIRNNNVSESEDLSRMQIAFWVLSYRASLLRKQIKDESTIDSDYINNTFAKTVNLLLTDPYFSNEVNSYMKSTVDTIADLFDKDKNNIISVYDQEWEPILKMNRARRKFHYYRKYTHGELTWSYGDNGKIYVQGYNDELLNRSIWVKYICCPTEADSEEDVYIPEWMIPAIKELIFKNELADMIKMPSDDTNNATLDGIKPDGPQEKEK